jgi:hypothetical protein
MGEFLFPSGLRKNCSSQHTYKSLYRTPDVWEKQSAPLAAAQVYVPADLHSLHETSESPLAHFHGMSGRVSPSRDCPYPDETNVRIIVYILPLHFGMRCIL